VIAEDESDTRILFLKIYDEGSGSKVEMDREKAAEKVREDMKKERLELKKILNKELGWFSSDDEIKEEPGVEESFQFEFSEEKDSVQIEKTENKRSKRRNKRQKTDSTENKPATKFVIDE